MLAQTPPLGWNSWNTFGENISEDLVREIADVIAADYKPYEYIVLDDCWSEKSRENGKLVADRKKFPSGIKALADYVHGKGLKLGIYSCAGTHTCAGYPGSFEHEFTDAQTFAEWGVDFLKYDYCYKPFAVPGEILYKRMGTALKNCGRDIVFSACNWGQDGVTTWIRESGAHLYRAGGDIQDNWKSIKEIVIAQYKQIHNTAAFCHRDLDMLVVGMYGKGDNSAVALGGCNDREYQTHFAIWAVLGSPLFIGADVRKLGDSAKKILTNPDIIAINQDPEARNAYHVHQWNTAEPVFALVRPLSNGDFGIVLANLSETPWEMSLQFWDIGLSAAAGKDALSLYDCVAHEDMGVYHERYAQTVEPHDCRVFRARVV